MTKISRTILALAAGGVVAGLVLAPASACEWMKNKQTTAQASGVTKTGQAMTPVPEDAGKQAADSNEASSETDATDVARAGEPAKPVAN